MIFSALFSLMAATSAGEKPTSLAVTPVVKWGQNPAKVFLSVSVPEVVPASVNVTLSARGVDLKAEGSGGTVYALTVDLLREIDVNVHIIFAFKFFLNRAAYKIFII